MTKWTNSKKIIVFIVILIVEAFFLGLSLSSIVLSQGMHVDYTEDMFLDEDGIRTPETILPNKGIYTVDVYLDTDDANIYINTVGMDHTIGNMLGTESVFLENGEDHFSYDIYAHINDIPIQTVVTTELRSEAGHANVTKISIDYQKWHSFTYYIISILFWLGMLDSLVFLCLFKMDFLSSFIKDRGLIFILFTATVIIASLPIMVKDIPMGDDLPFHLMRIQGIADGLQSGYIPVKIHDRWYNDFCLPAGVFYGQILLYPSAVLRLFGFPLGHTYRIYIVLINILTVTLTFYPFKKMLKNRYYAAAVTMFYTLSLYRLMDIHKRAAVGEYTAMAFLPIVMLGLAMLYGYVEKDGDNRAWSYLAVGMTGILQSHMLTVFMLMIFGVIVVLLNVRKTFCKETLIQYAKCFIMILLLNLFYIVPFFDYYMSYSLKMKEMKKDIAAKAAYLPQIFAQVYNVKGYNGEHTPVGDMPMSVGIVAVFVFATIVVIACRKGLGKCKRVVRDMMIVTAVFIFMASDLFPYNYLREYCNPIYELLQKMQYPWRFLTVVTIMLACLFSVCIVMIASIYGKRIAVIYVVVLVGMTMIQSKGMEDSIINEKSGKSYYSMSEAFWTVCEYLPRNTDIEELYNTELITSSEGVIASDIVRDNVNSVVTVNNTTSETGYVQLPQLCYPHFISVDDNGNDLEVIVGDYYKMCFAVPAGYNGKVYTYFKEPIIWRLAESVSLLTLLLSILYIIKRKSIRKNTDIAR